jgi:hypothetical protein
MTSNYNRASEIADLIYSLFGIAVNIKEIEIGFYQIECTQDSEYIRIESILDKYNKELEMLHNIYKDEFIVCSCYEVQELMELDGFKENSHVINNETLCEEYGNNSYFVRKQWLEIIND